MRRPSQILGERRELHCDRCVIEPGKSAIEPMVDMVWDQRAFGLLNRLFHSMQFLREIDASLLAFNHLDDAHQMPDSTPQPLDDCRMGCVKGVFFVISDWHPPRGDEATKPRHAEPSTVTRTVTGFLRIVLTIALAMGMISASNSRMVSHDIAELTKIVTEHLAGSAGHGHAHEDTVDILHAYHGHVHDVADHDHNIAFLPPRTSSSMAAPTRTTWPLASDVMPDRSRFDLDRPPRV
jgi:hypothetical protein